MDENTSQLSDEQIDSLVERSETPQNRDVPMTETAPAAEPEAPKPEEYEFEAAGKKYKATRDQLIAWAKQGVNYPQKMHQLNQERAKWDQDRQGWENNWGQYRQIDEWARNNPQHWAKLQQMWNGGQVAAPPAQPGADQPDQRFDQFKNQLVGELRQTLQPIFEEREQARVKQADQDLDQEIKSVREKFSSIDFNSTNEDGRTIEKQILDFAIENKIPKFEVAAKAFLHDQLMAGAQAQAKMDVSKSIQRDTKLGILGKEPIPKKKGFTEANNVRNRSYEDLTAEALAELKSMRA